MARSLSDEAIGKKEIRLNTKLGVHSIGIMHSVVIRNWLGTIEFD
jgi:hypothetical protein